MMISCRFTSSLKTAQQLRDAHIIWLRLPRRNRLRFGQWLINNFTNAAIWPELFYERDETKAYNMALEEIYGTRDVLV